MQASAHFDERTVRVQQQGILRGGGGEGAVCLPAAPVRGGGARGDGHGSLAGDKDVGCQAQPVGGEVITGTALAGGDGERGILQRRAIRGGGGDEDAVLQPAAPTGGAPAPSPATPDLSPPAPWCSPPGDARRYRRWCRAAPLSPCLARRLAVKRVGRVYSNL